MNELILANPGTGKTTVLVNYIIKLLDNGVHPNEILCITFTRKAAGEISNRLKERLESREKIINAMQVKVHTFHSYALTYLEENEQQYEVLNNNAMRYSILKSFLKNEAFNYNREYIISEIVPKVENAIRYLKSYGVYPKDIDLNKIKDEIQLLYYSEGIKNITIEEQFAFVKYFKEAFLEYESSKQKLQIDYNDILTRFLELKNKPKFKYVLVDEFQDVNRLEAKIAVESGEELFFVGDRKQAIFGFQGGSVENFDYIIEQLNPKISKLVENYRSAKEIIEYASNYFKSKTSNISHSKELDGFYTKIKSKGVVCVIKTENKTQENVAVKKAVELFKNGKKTAIITRTNGQLINISRILDTKNITYTTTQGNATSQAAKERIVTFLKGVLTDNTEDIIAALFTPFSPITLKEAFHISSLYNKKKLNAELLNQKIAKFLKLKNTINSTQSLLDLFDNNIIPISFSISEDFKTTSIKIREDIKNFFTLIKTPQEQELFDYIDITEQNNSLFREKDGIVLTTVHKAKGLEFDNVVYVPLHTQEKMSFIDVVVYSVIKTKFQKNTKEELKEEKLRVDFVAFTRAKQQLYIITNNQNVNDYLDKTILMEYQNETEFEVESQQRKYDQIFSLFINGEKEKASNLLHDKDNWLAEEIITYFNNVTHLSFSFLNKLNDPFGLFKSYIAGIKDDNMNLRIGTNAHNMAELIFKENINIQNINQKDLKYYENIKKINNILSEKYQAKQITAEESITIPLNYILNYNKNQNLTFNAKIDAVYKNGDKYIILDYKTDKTQDRISEHKQQLITYQKIYAISKNINEDNISVFIAFIGLKGKINTGSFGFELNTTQPSQKVFDTVKRRIEKFLIYKDDPKLFIKELIAQETKSILHEQIKQILSKNIII